MNELIEKLKTTVGLSTDQATAAAKCVNEYLKDKVPSLISNKLDDMFSGKKVDYGDILRDKANDLTDTGKEKMGEVANILDDLAEKVTDKSNDWYHKFTDFIKSHSNKDSNQA